MPSSWEPHRTVVEVHPSAVVDGVFSGVGASVGLEANEPLLMTNPGQVLFVGEGAIDLFFVDVVDGKPSGRRRHFVRVRKGDVAFGVPPFAYESGDRAVGLLAVGIGGTRMLELSTQRLFESAADSGALGLVRDMIDGWIRLLIDGLGTGEAAPDVVPLEAGQQVDLEAGQVATAGQGIVWATLLEGSIRYGGTTQLKGPLDPMFPLTRGTWVEALTPARLRVVSSETRARWERDLSSMAFFHKIVLTSLALSRESKRKEERGQFRDHTHSERRTIDEALRRLAETYGDRDRPKLVRAAEDDRLVAACRKACEGSSINIVAPPGSEHGATMEDIARVSHIRVRPIRLQEEWWKRANGPLVGYADHEDFPVALRPVAGGYELTDPLTTQTHRVDPSVASNIATDAWQLYRPFPARSLRALDVLRYALHDNVRDFVLIAVAGLLVGLLGLVVPHATGEIIDTIIPSADIGLAVQMGAALVVVAIATTLTGLARDTAVLRIETRASSSVQAAVWDRLLALPVPFFRRFSSGDLAVRAGAIDSIRRSLSGSTMNALLSSMFSLTSFGLLLYYSAKLAGVAALLALGSIIMAAIVGYASVRAHRRLEALEGKLTSLVLELLTGIAKLRIAGAEGRAFNVWAKLFATKERVAFDVKNLENRFGVVESVYPLVSSMVIYYLVATMPQSASFSTGEFLAFNAAYGMFIGNLLGLVSTAIDLAEVVPTYERARPLLEAVPEVDEAKAHPGELRGEIRVSHVKFRYTEAGPLVLDDVDFTISPGEFIAIVGTSASGKSSLLRAMLGFENPEGGGVYYDGQELTSIDVTEVRRQIGVVLQNGELMVGDIYQNIVGSRALDMDTVMEAIKAAGMEADIEAMPMGIHTMISSGGRSLSGGQRQRLMIARAIVNKPRIVFFDEATSALDNRTQSIVTRSLDQLRATRIVVAHRLSTIKDANRIIVLDRGRVVEMGTYEDLIAQEGVFAELAKRQMA